MSILTVAYFDRIASDETISKSGLAAALRQLGATEGNAAVKHFRWTDERLFDAAASTAHPTNWDLGVGSSQVGCSQWADIQSGLCVGRPLLHSEHKVTFPSTCRSATGESNRRSLNWI